jgi:glyoxylase-like metal-dependent hydrolase (beta-lactamase superfamily II)
MEIAELEVALRAELDRLDIAARPIVVPTPWDVGPVTAYLFIGDPVTLVDSGTNRPESIAGITAALAAEGLEPADVQRVIVTHAHSDHFGGALWLQNTYACRVLAHPDDIAISGNSDWRGSTKDLFRPLGFTDAEFEGFFFDNDNDDDEGFEWKAPAFAPMSDGEVFTCGESRLRIEHRAGHTPGHCWVVEERSGAIFVGDYVIADHPTNAGLEIDRTHPSGRAPLLREYNAGLRELMARDAPALFPAHGPPITGHADLIARRLAKTDRRTRHVGTALTEKPETALDIGRHLYRSRAEQSWEVMADVTGRLDLLVAEGRASARMGEDGVWYFTKADNA